MQVTEADLQKAFHIEKALYAELKSKEGEVEDTFWGLNTSREFLEKDATKVGNLWNHTVTVNRTPYNAFTIWRDHPNYCTSGRMVADTDTDRMAELMEKSDTEKVLYKTESFRISLVRDEIFPPTETCWGYTFCRPRYALIDKNDKVLIVEPKAWRFKKLCKGEITNEPPKTLIEKLKALNPFRMAVVNSTDEKRINVLCATLSMHIDRPEYYYERLFNKDLWVVFIYGLGGSRTWFFVESETEPTQEEALHSLYNIFLKYRDITLVEYLSECVASGIDTNKLDFEIEDRTIKVVNGKFINHVREAFNVSSVGIILDIIREDLEL